MTDEQDTVPIEKHTVAGETRVSFSGEGFFRLPDADADMIRDEARERFDLDALPDGAHLGTATVATDPTHRLVEMEWNDDGEGDPE